MIPTRPLSILLHLSTHVIEPMSLCPTLQKAKTQNVRVWSKERFIDGEGANPEFEDPSNASNLSLVLLCGMFYI